MRRAKHPGHRRRPPTPSRTASSMTRAARQAWLDEQERELDSEMKDCTCRCSHLYEAECDELCSPFGR